MIEDYLQVLELGYFEAPIAFEGLSDAHVWQRPAGGLLSVGELAAHVAYWEAIRFAGEGGENPPDLAKCRVQSVLLDDRFSYYPQNIAQPPTEAQRAMRAEQVCTEFVRIHEESVAVLKERKPDLDSTPPGWSPNQTYREILKYAAFHVSYHTGQMYSVRHLLGDTPPDN